MEAETIKLKSSNDFNEKYKAYLGKGHYGLTLDIPEVIELLDDIFKDLVKIPGFEYHQIKSKFGSCRFYSNLESAQLNYLIEKEVNKILNKKDEGSSAKNN